MHLLMKLAATHSGSLAATRRTDCNRDGPLPIFATANPPTKKMTTATATTPFAMS